MMPESEGPEMTIRPATPADLQSLVCLEQAVLPSPGANSLWLQISGIRLWRIILLPSWKMGRLPVRSPATRRRILRRSPIWLSGRRTGVRESAGVCWLPCWTGPARTASEPWTWKFGSLMNRRYDSMKKQVLLRSADARTTTQIMRKMPT